MIYLLDTNALLMFSFEPHRILDQANKVLNDRENTLLLSLASVWEIQIKTHLGKLDLGVDLETFITTHREKNGIVLLDINLEQIIQISRLAWLHKDPFDRLIISQALALDLTILTSDEIIPQYPVKTIWK